MKGLLILEVSLDCQISGIRKIQLLLVLFVRKFGNMKTTKLGSWIPPFCRDLLITLEAEEKNNPQNEMNQNLALTIHFFRFQICFDKCCETKCHMRVHCCFGVDEAGKFSGHEAGSSDNAV